MKIRIEDGVYDVIDAVNAATLNDLMELKIKTRRDGYPGVSVKTIQDMFTKRIPELAQDPDFETTSLLGDEDFLRNMIGVVFLARRRAGDKISVEQAGEISFMGLQFIQRDEGPDDSELAREDVPFSEADGESPQTSQI